MTMRQEDTVNLRPRSRWADDASCRTHDIVLFFGTEKRPLLGVADAEPGMRICKACPVRRDCLLDSLLTQEWVGLRGGFLGAERRRSLSRNGTVAAAMAAYDAGTFTGSRRG